MINISLVRKEGEREREREREKNRIESLFIRRFETTFFKVLNNLT